jgi:hypothetical protein
MWWFTVTVAFLISITFLRKLKLQLSIESGGLRSENYLEGKGGWVRNSEEDTSSTHPLTRQSETTLKHLRQLTVLVGNFLSYI